VPAQAGIYDARHCGFDKSNPYRFALKVRYVHLFSPNNGRSAVVTDTKDWGPEELLLFVVLGGSAQETSIGELKTDFAFDHIPTNTYQTNSAYQQISQMAYNSAISMQHSMGVTKKQESNRKRTRIYSPFRKNFDKNV